MTNALHPENSEVNRTGDQAMATYQRWRSRMIRRTSHPALPSQPPSPPEAETVRPQSLASGDDLHS